MNLKFSLLYIAHKIATIPPSKNLIQPNLNGGASSSPILIEIGIS